MNNPLVSIIIPTYNRAHLIGETLDSVLVQTYENWECIIVDDGSTDNSAEIIGNYVKNDSRFQYHHRPESHKPGGNGARNYGFEISKGEYINWFDSDDLMISEKLQKNINEFLNNPDLEMCFSKASYFDRDDNEILFSTKAITNNIFLDYVLKKISISCQVPMWKKQFLINTKLFNEDTLRGQEFEFYSEILYNNKLVFKALNCSLVKIRIHQNSITATFNNADIAKLKSYVNITTEVLIKISKLNDPQSYLQYVKILYKDLFLYVRSKQYKLALNLSKSILNYSNSNYFYFLKNHLIFRLIILLKGKGYHKLKKLIK